MIIAPPSGKYATLDDTELAIITEGSITGVLDVRAALNGEDISTALDTCGTASQLPSGEFVLRCPDVGELLKLELGRYLFDVQLDVQTGDQGMQTLVSSVVWDILGILDTDTDTDTAVDTDTYSMIL